MSEHQHRTDEGRETRESYRQARTAFDALNIEDKAVFLVEAVASTLARGLQSAGQTLADEIDRAFRTRPHDDAPEQPSEDEAADAVADDLEDALDDDDKPRH